MSSRVTADLPASDLVRLTTSGGASAKEVVEASLDRISKRDPGLNAFSVVLADEARADAARLDALIAEGGQPGPLHGVPVAIKEELDVAGCVTTFGGVANSTPVSVDGEVVRRLRQAGAVIVGKTRMPEFGQWPFTESVAGGVTRNPWDRSHTPGGSSGGTAAAVASGMVPVGLGGDGGGSIRIPSACCGLFGLKPTRGRVTSDPMPHLWWALGTTGPLTRTVLDSALVYDVIRGNLAGDRFRAPEPETSFIAAAGADPGKLRIGWSTVPVTKGVKPAAEHVAAVHETAALLADLGHDVREVDPRYPDPTAAFIPQFFGGVRAEADAMEHFGRLEKRTRETYRLGSWVSEAIVEKAMAAGDKVAERANRVFDEVDVLLSPVIGPRPRRVGALNKGGTIAMSLKSRPMVAWTALWNVTGNPAASVPTGIAADGLPVAVQLVGRIADETTLLSLSAQIERARAWPLLTDSSAR
ncbi:amidase [Nocardioides marmorisolisilvae]|uniref:Amidase n=1 Tax=Nocardioides marmorisolisilvae TaxID=1542737 RepID=A0A3N0DSR6_9ACTN|nr:amidase [Nocardioides marmorisolisilvae]RNL78662.1 amidase [Nocardioides marmorisolisilvae]